MKLAELLLEYETDPDFLPSRRQFERDEMKPAIARMLGVDVKELQSSWNSFVAGDPFEDEWGEALKRETLSFDGKDGDGDYHLSLHEVDGFKFVMVEFSDYGGSADPQYFKVKGTKAPKKKA